MTDAKTIVQAWLGRCRAEPRKTALRHKRRGIWRAISWQDYHHAVLRIGLAIENAGLGRGAVVSIVSESRPEWLYVDMAAQALGCVSHGAYPTCSAQRIMRQLSLAGTDIVFVENAEQAEKILEVQPLLPGLRRIVVFDARGLRELKSDQVVSLAEFVGDQAIGDLELQRFEQSIGHTQVGDIAFLCTTAGSTGVPRLAAITHEAALRRARTMQTAFNVHTGDRTLCFVPLANAAERLFSAVLPLLVAVQVHFPENPATVANDLREIQPDWVHAPPRFWEKLLARTESIAMLASPLARRLYRHSMDSRRTDWIRGLSQRHLRRSMGLARARAGYSGGAAVAPALHRWFLETGLTLWDVYESAETCGPALRFPLAQSGDGAELDTEVKIGTDNELMIRSTALFSGYWADKTLVAVPPTENGWFATGDAVQVEGDGLRVAGRLRSRFSTHDGRQVLPEAIERELHANPYIANAVVLGGEGGQCACLLGLEMESVLSFAQAQAIPFVDFSHLVRNKAIRSLLHKQVASVNQRLGDGKRIGRFSVLVQSLNPGDEEMTPALRAQRVLIMKRFEAEVRELNAVDAGGDAAFGSDPREQLAPAIIEIE